MQAYCFKCKKKVEMRNTEKFKAQDRRMTRGNWIFFNLDEIITPSNPRQMPSGSTVGLFNVTGVDSWGQVKLTTQPFATFTV